MSTTSSSTTTTSTTTTTATTVTCTTTSTAPPVLHYTLDDADITGVVVDDESPEGNDGQLGDGADPTTYPSSAPGVRGEGRRFYQGDWIETPDDNSLDFSDDPFTIECWIKTAAAMTYGRL